ncbi:hypothetical protein LCGC14_2915870 [marine sediment metagenome]|uniref:Uncharacterized protein n=1 Tax=marine sediment metagenome TaxID=412755 RepID=A0A0F8YC33_9ZZZZ
MNIDLMAFITLNLILFIASYLMFFRNQTNTGFTLLAKFGIASMIFLILFFDNSIPLPYTYWQKFIGLWYLPISFAYLIRFFRHCNNVNEEQETHKNETEVGEE